MFMHIFIFLCTVDDGGDEEETNMRNGGDRGESDSVLKNLSSTWRKQQLRSVYNSD